MFILTSSGLGHLLGFSPRHCTVPTSEITVPKKKVSKRNILRLCKQTCKKLWVNNNLVILLCHSPAVPV